jgi:hypothetical protein
MPTRNRSTRLKSILRQVRNVKSNFNGMYPVNEKLLQIELLLAETVNLVSSRIIAKPRIKPASMKLIVDLYNDGYMYKQITHIVGTSESTVRRVLVRHGLTGTRQRPRNTKCLYSSVLSV